MPIDLGGLLGADLIQRTIEACALCTVIPFFLGMSCFYISLPAIIPCVPLCVPLCGVRALSSWCCIAGCAFPGLYCALPTLVVSKVGQFLQMCTGESCPICSLLE